MGSHAVQLYQDEADLADALARFAASGLALGEGVVVIGSSPRWKALTERLRAGGVDTHGAVLRGQLRLFGARVILSSCMSHGVPARDCNAFNEAVSSAIREVLEPQLVPGGHAVAAAAHAAHCREGPGEGAGADVGHEKCMNGFERSRSCPLPVSSL